MLFCLRVGHRCDIAAKIALKSLRISTTTITAASRRYYNMNTTSKKINIDDLLFQFDLNGYCVVKGVLNESEVSEFNTAIDNHQDEFHERVDSAVRNTKPGTPLAGDGKAGRKDLAGMLEWPEPDCLPFRSMLAHPALIPLIHKLVGKGYRLDHLPFVIAQDKGSEGFRLHGGPLTSDGGFNTSLQYVYRNGSMHNSLLAMSVVLSPHRAGDGGFCVVRGSHKVNIPVPDDMMNGINMTEHIYQPVTEPGDIVFFSEATVHGSMPWTAEHQRRIVLYRFAPATCGYGRGYTPKWPEAMLRGCTATQRAVLEPPYHNRLDRPYIVEETMAVESTSRSDEKKTFDKIVFGKQYF
eukprot:m.52800 g.52800  ORF g.52800 m.52800 type:complete len:352 (+) comp10819_c0_seq1:264-1319(+)